MKSTPTARKMNPMMETMKLILRMKSLKIILRMRTLKMMLRVRGLKINMIKKESMIMITLCDV